MCAAQEQLPRVTYSGAQNLTLYRNFFGEAFSIEIMITVYSITSMTVCT